MAKETAPSTKSESDMTDKEREAKWRAESDLRTLAEAKEIRMDDKRLKAAIAMGKMQLKSIEAALKDSKV